MKLNIVIRIEVEQNYQPGQSEGYGNLQLQQELIFKPRGFLEMCRILGQFQELAERLSKEPGK